MTPLIPKTPASAPLSAQVEGQTKALDGKDAVATNRLK